VKKIEDFDDDEPIDDSYEQNHRSGYYQNYNFHKRKEG